MLCPTVSTLIVIVLGLSAALPGSTMGQAERTSEPAIEAIMTTSTSQEVTNPPPVSSPRHRRQDLLDLWLTNEVDTRLNKRESRLNGLDTRVSAQLNALDARLIERDARLNDVSRQQIELNTRLNRMDGRLDTIETGMSDMKEYVQQQMEAMGRKVELALGQANTKQQNTLEKSTVDSTDFRPPRVPQVHKGCQDALRKGWMTSGIYTISPEQGLAMDVYCDQQIDGGGWTVFQARKDGSVNFYQNWSMYKSGFGDLRGEFWLGNANIYLLTKHHDQQLKVELTSPGGEVKYADYNSFCIGDEADKYKLNVTGFTGESPPGDSLARRHNGAYFSTKDADYDESIGSCAAQREGAWWYTSCTDSNLNGNYTGSGWKGVVWKDWKPHTVSMKGTRMLIRRKS